MTNERFEGLYGRVYTHVIHTRTLRRAVFSLWGSADPLLCLDEIVAAAEGAGTGRCGWSRRSTQGRFAAASSSQRHER
jgi:hypothetical protein